ncbi:MAG: hypothetical protein FWD60_11815 [Candidatus Azobacteroides sp.]|nr:hypothetical protein [Candidatus Azobacteroides sp.]
MVTTSDLQKWQTATNGINESGQKDLTGEEWSALVTLNNSLQNGNFDLDESRRALALLKNNLDGHGNNQILQTHLQNFIALCEQYDGTTNVPAFTANTTARTSETAANTVKTKGKSNKNLILIIVALIIGYLVYSHWDAISGMGNGGLPNGRYELANPVGAGSLPDKIIISGNNFTTKFDMFGVSSTLKFKYEDGKVTVTDKGMSVSVPCEFKNGSLWYGGMEYKKVK